MTACEFNDATSLLGRKLQHLRVDAGLTTTSLAMQAGMSRSKLSKIEHGHLRATPPTIRALGRVLQLSAAQVEELIVIDLRTEAAKLPVHNASQRAYVTDEARAKQQQVLSDVVPALLQTDAYTRAYTYGSADDQINLDQFVVDRMKRRWVLFDLTRTFRFVFPKNTLELDALDDADATFQLYSLLHAARLPNVCVRLTEEHLGIGACVLDGTLFIDSINFVVRADDEERVRTHNATFEAAWSRAAPEEESIALIERMAATRAAAMSLDVV